MSRQRARILFLLLLLCAGASRFLHLDWDEGHHLHPDERFISMVEEKLSWPASLGEYFDSAYSPLNPYNRGNASFVYGTLPVVLAKAAGQPLGKIGYGGTYLFGRSLSALFDLLTVLLVYRIARCFAGRRTSLMAAGLLAFCAFSIQLSHFWTSDTFLTTFTAAALLGSVRIAQGRAGWAGDLATGACLGLATACKVTAMALLLPIGVALLLAGLAAPGRERGIWVLRHAGRLLLIVATAAMTVRVALPTAFLGPNPMSFRLDPRWVNDLKNLANLTKSAAGYPPNLQWAGRSFLFPIRNFVLWGAGVPFGITALISLVWALAASRKRKMWALLPLVLHPLFLFVYHGTTMVKTMRYFYPAYPALAVLAALGAHALANSMGRSSRAVRAVPALVLVGTALWALAFVSIYARPHTRLEASRWIFEHVPPPARIANESWDDGLPIPLPGYDNGKYSGPMLELWGPDNQQKVGEIVKTLSDTDWIAITSGRVYMNITRLPTVFPMTTAYYRALFEGRLGFEQAADFASYPRLGPLRFPDDTAEEQFTVYDHPRVVLFRRGDGFSPERARQILLSAIPTTPPTVAEWEKLPRSQRWVADPLIPPRTPTTEKLPGAGAAEAKTNSAVACVLFYVASLAVGVFAFPIAWVLFRRLSDRGAGVARILGLVATTYLLAFALKTHLLENGRPAALICMALLAAGGVAAFLMRRREIAAFWQDHRRLILHGEIVFAAGFLFFVGMRALNPEIFWGEKPMDFSILNILMRAPGLPPSDPWFAGARLGYYYFGQEMIAFLTLVTGLSTRYTFNLAFGLIGGLTLQAAFTLLRNWAGNLRAAVAGAAFTGILGNLAGLREWLINQSASGHPRHLDWHYFWATSRVIAGTINEYPFWSLLFADLHAHVLAFPLFLFFAAVALQFVRAHADAASSWPERIFSAALLGFAAATQALTNAWDVPLLAGLLVLLLLVTAFPQKRVEGAAMGRALVSFCVAAAAVLAFVLPLWVRGGGSPGYGKNVGVAEARGIDVLTVFGLFFFLAIAWWMISARRRLIDGGWPRVVATVPLVVLALGLATLAVLAPTAFCVAGVILFLIAAIASRGPAEDRLAFGFVAAGFALIYFTQRFFIYDRMNTFFKLYVEVWLLFSIGTAALVFRPADRPGSFARWGRPLRFGFYGLLALALFTTVTAAQGAIDRTTSPSALESPPAGGPRHFVPAHGPSLDGLRYLEDKRPGEYRAILWLRRTIRGTPVVLEAQGPSYQDFGRISMLTGLPTVLGWDYHVQQRGNPQPEIEARKEGVRAIYSSPDAATAQRLLLRYHVGYVYVGWLERQTYPAEGLKKFGSNKDLFALAYENPEARVYRVVGGDTQDVPMPIHEKIEAPASVPEKPAENEPEETPEISRAAEKGLPPFAGMKEPRDASVDGEGRVWIADFGNSRLRVFDQNGGFLGGWGGRGGGTFGLREPCGVAIHEKHLYIADTWNGRVQHFTLEGEWKGTVAGLYGPRGVAAASDGTVWVSDTGNNRVLHYDADLGLLGSTGQKGSGRGEFQDPVGIAVGDSGSVYVADVDNRRIVVLGASGQFERAFPLSGWRKPGEPHIEVGPGETLFVTDPESNELLELDRNGSMIARLTADDAHKPFDRPTGVAIDRRRAILYVVNSGSNTVSSVRLPERKSP